MKNIFKTLPLYMWLISAAFFVVSCQKSDSSISYGIANIYMPQAINVSAGVNNNYPVPSGTDSTTYNYKIDSVNKKLNVILGVALSGEEASLGYTVDVKTNSDTLNQLISNGTLDATTVLMPASMYTMPSQVAVPAGVSGKTFYLSVDINQIKANYIGKKLALAVSLNNPSSYSLNKSIATTIIIITVNSLKL